MTGEMKVKTINFRGSAIPHYVIWKELFKVYRENGGDLDNMWDMVCDLTIIKKDIIKHARTAFYWGFSGNYTEITYSESDEPLYPPFATEDVYLICVDYKRQEAFITKEY